MPVRLVFVGRYQIYAYSDNTPVGHTSVQQPHSPQRRGSCSSTWSSSSPNAPVGHSFTHAPQPRHIKERSIITDIKITTVKKSFLCKLYHECAGVCKRCVERKRLLRETKKKDVQQEAVHLYGTPEVERKQKVPGARFALSSPFPRGQAKGAARLDVGFAEVKKKMYDI